MNKLKQNKMKNLSEIKKEIENTLKKNVNIEYNDDCINLLFIAKIKNIIVANIYKSYNDNFERINIIRYTGNDIY